MGILMPALRRTREQARMVSCAANLRQWNITLQTYVTTKPGLQPVDGPFWKKRTGGEDDHQLLLKEFTPV